MRYLLPAAVLLAATSVPALAQMERYEAVSNTAMSVTGDVETDDFEIVFANGERLVFSDLVADHFQVDGRNVPASVYRIETPGDPELLNGNLLCGSGDVTYLASWLEDDLTVMAVFTGAEPPQSSDEMCASYSYAITE